MRARSIAHATAAFLIGSAVAALVLFFILPFPSTPIGVFSRFGQLMLLSLVGSAWFAWAWGPAALGPLGLVAAIAIPAATVSALVFGFFRKQSYPALVCAALLWSAFGGFSAYVAVTGSI